MKKIMMKFLFISSLLALSAACATTSSSKPVSLDNAIAQTSHFIETRFTEKARVAVLNISFESDNVSQYIIDELISSLVNAASVTVVDRQESDLILAERNIQLSGEVSDETAQGIGKTLGVQYIITGSLIETGIGFRLRTKMLNVETRQIMASFAVDINRRDKQISYLY